MLSDVLLTYGIDEFSHRVVPFGSGLINRTWRVTGIKGDFILQEINTAVFKRPEDIADNLENIKKFLQSTNPGYCFAAPVATLSGDMITFSRGRCYRLLPFVKGSVTVNFLKQPKEAFEAAKQFGKFVRLLDQFPVDELKYTLPDFHNLDLRIKQFEWALGNAERERLDNAAIEIRCLQKLMDIGQLYRELVAGQTIPLRVTHHDTKISNVLFNEDGDGIAVIDLDTVMPGYFISDVGDMMRTYLAEANEEEKELDKIMVRPEFFAAIYKGYMSEMGDILTPREKDLFFYSGKFMIYMQALRFLTDYLSGDVYYHTTYAGQNLVRAKNQIDLLTKYIANKELLLQGIGVSVPIRDNDIFQ